MDKTTTQLKTNSKIENNNEEIKRYIENKEKDKNNTCILRRSHDQQESREVIAQRYPIRFHGHKAIHCRAHDRITPERNQSTFYVQCYNCYHYSYFAKHCRI